MAERGHGSDAASGSRRRAAAARPAGPVGPGDAHRAQRLHRSDGAAARGRPRLGIRTVRDLLFHLPRRYDDLRALSTARELASIPDGETGQRAAGRARYPPAADVPAARAADDAYLGDDTGEVEATWFGRRCIEKRLHDGERIVVSGKVKRRGFTTTFDNPEFQPDDGSALLHAGRIVPVYRLTAGLTAATLRRAIRQALDDVGGTYPEYLPPAARAAEAEGADSTGSGAGGHAAGRRVPPPAAFTPIAEALESAHYPETFPARDAALRRLGFDELLALAGRHGRPRPAAPRGRGRGRGSSSAAQMRPRRGRRSKSALTAQVRARTGSDEPAHLTADQVAAVTDIVADLGRPRPMMRLLQGDVGSGKTAVAALALAFAADAGRQGALLAPTDLLARQHAVALRRFLEPLGHGVTLLTGSLPAAERPRRPRASRAPRFDRGLLGLTTGRVVVGHPRARPGVGGVRGSRRRRRRRAAPLRRRPARGPRREGPLAARPADDRHADTADARPDPARGRGRQSDLRALPAGRLKIRTGIRRSDELPGVGDDPARGAYPLIVREVRAGHRAFVVVPLVEEDEESAARSAAEVAAALPGQLAPTPPPRPAWRPIRPSRVGVVHGQMKAAARDATMDRFRRATWTSSSAPPSSRWAWTCPRPR